MSVQRLIDANAFCAFLREVSTRQHYEKLLCKKDKYPTVADVIEEICCDLDGTSINGFDNAPTVDAIVNTIEVRPQGEWYYSIDKGWECNQCHEIVKDMPTCMRKALYNFCPNCGADMRGDENGKS